MASEARPAILLVEPDEGLAQPLCLDLQEAGYTPLVAADVTEALRQTLEQQPALILADRLLGSESGLQLCTQLRSQGNRTPVIIFMARNAVDDLVACLEAGADDYLLKPYRSEDVLRRVRLYLQPETATTEKLRFGDLMLDLSTRRALRNGRAIELTMKEFELLKYLMEHPREVLTREQILENVWGYDFVGESNVIEVYIRYLRLKIEDEGEKRLIQTVRGVGYVLRET